MDPGREARLKLSPEAARLPGCNRKGRYSTEQPGDQEESAEAAPGAAGELPQMPLGIVIARIVIVSGMSFAAALGIFFLVGGIWLIGLGAIAVTVVFLVLMFAIERLAEH